jgi:hypothetical protein
MRGRRTVFFLGIIAIFAVFSLAVMLLWNAVLPHLLGAPDINYLQAAGLLALCRILFGGPGAGHIKSGLRARLHGMNPDEREALMSRMHERFTRGWGGWGGWGGHYRSCGRHHGRARREPDSGKGPARDENGEDE